MCSVTGCLCGESCPQNRACSGYRVKARRCLHKNCGKRFVPECGAQIFCSDECRKNAGLDDLSLLQIIQTQFAAETDGRNRLKQQVKRAKKKFYRTDRGRQVKSAENKRYYARKREQRQPRKSAVPESENSPSILHCFRRGNA